MLNNHIETALGVAGGKPRIAGRRITVANVVIWHKRLGKSVGEIADEHDLTLAEVRAALAYYSDHRVEIDRSIAESEVFVQGLRERTPSKIREKRRRKINNDMVG